MAIERGPAQPPALRELSTTAIANTLGVSAVDVFVYDTRKDSDGGAWRKRTQHTSWYNETLNTATRGVRREFPAVAVIVSTLDTVTIYDGDDPDLPMWMVFNAGSAGLAGTPMVQNYNGFSLAALNGVLVIGTYTTTDNWGSPIINFISEKVVRMDPHTSEGGTWLGDGIVDRNLNKGYASKANSGGGYVIVNSIIYDVAMTVLPNAPLDPATGLSIPTIVVATQGGVSVIHSNDTVINKAGGIYLRVEAYDTHYIAKGNGDDLSIVNWNDVGTTINYTIGDRKYNGNPATNYYPYLYGNGGKIVSLVGERSFAYSAAPNGVQIYSESGPTDRQSMIASIKTKSNTGWMPGDIRCAWLGDTTQETLVGTQLISNGDFATNSTADWVPYNSTLSASSNQMTITRTGGTGLCAYRTFTTTIGKLYTISAKINSAGSRGDLIVKDAADGGGTTIINLNGTNGSTVTLQRQFVAQSAAHTIMFAIDSNNTSIIVDDISVRQADPDLTVYGKGLSVYGTISKTPVATGSDVLGYSGFSSSNYLYQPYNSSMAVGSGTQTVIAWFKADVAQNMYLIHRGENDASESLRIAYSAPNYIYFDYGNSTSYVTCALPPTGVWHHLVCTVTAGQVGKVYVNGVLQTNINAGAAPSTFLESSSYPTTIGGSVVYGGWWVGSLALVRYSLTAVTSEQVAKMYSDEKELFQENAKATLYGTYDSVSAMAYDDSTNLLHIGTSSGRSVFQGLRRVENTTDAVTTSISASNGMVVEQ